MTFDIALLQHFKGAHMTIKHQWHKATVCERLAPGPCTLSLTVETWTRALRAPTNELPSFVNFPSYVIGYFQQT